MSTSLYWRRVSPMEGDLSIDLKKAIAHRFWGHDGTLAGDHHIVDRGSIDYLSGLADAGVDGAEELINLIRQHGQIDLWVE